jgi:hypothetical protein
VKSVMEQKARFVPLGCLAVMSKFGPHGQTSRVHHSFRLLQRIQLYSAITHIAYAPFDVCKCLYLLSSSCPPYCPLSRSVSSPCPPSLCLPLSFLPTDGKRDHTNNSFEYKKRKKKKKKRKPTTTGVCISGTHMIGREFKSYLGLNQCGRTHMIKSTAGVQVIPAGGFESVADLMKRRGQSIPINHSGTLSIARKSLFK